MRIFGPGLLARIAAASVLLALLVAVAFVLLLASIGSLRDASRQARRSEEILATASALERRLIDLETGQRGFVITRQERFLEPYRAAVATIPQLSARLERLVRGDPRREAAVRSIDAGIRDYEQNWTAPVIRTARVDPARARSLIATAAGKRRVDRLRARFERLTAAETRLSEDRRATADDQAARALAFGVGGIGVSALLVAVFAAYLARLVVRPIRAALGGTRALAAGDLSVRVPEAGTGEIRELTADFNTMAASLERGRAELQRQKAELEAVLDAVADGVAMAAPNGSLVFTNRPMDRYWDDFGVPPRGTIWERLAMLAARTTTPGRYAADFRRVLADPEGVYSADFELTSSGRIFLGYTAPVHDGGGTAIGRIFTVREITGEREVERLKDEFVATVSHELRTPLTSMIGFVEMLLQESVGPLGEDQRRFLGIVHRSSQRLMRLVGDLLFVAQLEAGRLSLQLGEVDLRELVDEAVEAARPLAEHRGLELACSADGVPTIEADRSRIAQLLDNLISNALKFTPEGGRVDVTAGADDGYAWIEVRDTGMGISEAEQARLFERFFRTDEAMSRSIAGTGLGLSISKAIAEGHGGTITFTSAPGEGTCFRVELPLTSSRRS